MTSSLRARLERPGFSLDVDFSWNERVVVLFGPSGSGKTTLLEIVLGLHRNAEVALELAGEWLEDTARGLRTSTQARRLGWVPQDPTLFPHLDVAGNLRFGLSRAGPAGAPLLERAIEVLEIGALLDRRVEALSGGERQRVALARAIASGPRALLLDEPLAALDLPLRARVLPYLLRVRDELDLPMIHITHDPDEALLLGERVVVLDRGRVVASGPPQQVLWSHAVHPLSEALGLDNVLEARADDAPGDEPIARTRSGLALALPWSVAPGEELSLGIRAEDLLLSVDPPGRISARNVLEAEVRGVETRDDSALVRLDAGEPLIAKLTPTAVAKLSLAPGQRVFILFKAQAIRRLR